MRRTAGSACVSRLYVLMTMIIHNLDVLSQEDLDFGRPKTKQVALSPVRLIMTYNNVPQSPSLLMTLERSLCRTNLESILLPEHRVEVYSKLIH